MALLEISRADVVAIERELGKRSFKHFAQMAWPVIEPSTKLKWGWAMEAICDHLQAVSEGKFSRLLMNVPPGTSKSLEENTQILTLDGWKRHGDLRVDDYVFGPDGLPKRVVGCSPNYYEESASVRFDDGSEIVSGYAHEWVVERDKCSSSTGWNRIREPIIVETKDLIHGGRPDRIRNCKAIYQPYRQLPIDPYIFGAWLGDGSSGNGYLNVSHEDIEHFKQYGTISRVEKPDDRRKQPFYRVLVPDLQFKLRALMVLNNKHIPDNYLFSDATSRIALLQGLLDTDGHVDKYGMIFFSNNNEQIIDAAYHLAASFGAKPVKSARYSTLNGKRFGPHYRITFTSPKGFDFFRLERKQKKVRQSEKDRSFCRYVKSVTSVGKRITKCIQVEGGVYLAGKNLVPTHNSTLSSVLWPAWEWTRSPGERFLGTAHKQDLALRDNMKCRRLIQSSWYQERWPLELMGDSNAKSKFENEHLGFREAMAFTSLTGSRGSRVIIDDPLSADDANSQAALKAAELTFLESLPTRVNDEDSAIVIIMQRLHERDTSGIILAKELPYVHLCLPMRFEPDRRCTTPIFSDPRTAEGELLFPERFPESVVLELEKTLGSYASAGQLQQRPSPRGGGIFKLEWLHFWTVLPRLEWRTIYADTAQKTAEQHDYSVFQCWGRGTDGKAYLLDQIRGKWEAPELLAQARAFWAKHKALDGYEMGTLRALKAEDKSSGTGLIQSLKREAIPIVGIPRDKDKQVRAFDAAPLLEAGLVCIPHAAPWVSDFMAELTSFPAAAHDDQIDPLMDAVMDIVGNRKVSMMEIFA